jgi:hypothetical protein
MAAFFINWLAIGFWMAYGTTMPPKWMAYPLPPIIAVVVFAIMRDAFKKLK